MQEQEATEISHPIPIMFGNTDEFQSRERYFPKLSCSKEELAYLVGKYDLPKSKWIRCGLNGCTKLHGLGFVYAKVSGEESHCGQNCGRREFGLKWNEVMARFQQTRKADERRRLLENFQAEANDIIRFADDYLVQAVDLCNQLSTLIRQFFEPTPDLYNQLKNCAKNGGKIQVANYSAKRLGSDLGYHRGKVDLTTVAEIKHSGVLEQRKSIVADTERAVKSTRVLQTLDINALSQEELTYHSRKFQEAREQLNRTGRFNESAKKFLRPSNLSTLKELRRLFPKNQGGKIARALDALDAYCDATSVTG